MTAAFAASASRQVLLAVGALLGRAPTGHRAGGVRSDDGPRARFG
ncbi:hypothetical protein [Streptomyces sp. YIM B13518]